MPITIRTEDTFWLVSFDKHCIRFRSREEAEHYAATLRLRVNAPHPWPRPALAKAG